jgi:hypothetical protein
MFSRTLPEAEVLDPDLQYARNPDPRRLRKTRGLRSVPELILTEIPMSSIGVIHLAGMLFMLFDFSRMFSRTLPEAEVLDPDLQYARNPDPRRHK